MDSHDILSHQRMNSDIISNLPEEIIDNILARLSIRDVVRTSILSRNWRYKWTTLPDLVINFRSIDHPYIYKSSQIPVFMIPDEEKVVQVIHRILSQYKGPIHEFSFSATTSRSYPDIDQWIEFLSRNGIREFTLNCVLGDQYKIHSSLFSFVSLRELWLRDGCIVPSPPPTFNGFNHLTFLTLEMVTINNEGFENLMAKCPQLITLCLYFVEGLDRLNIHHAPKLQTLFFEGVLKSICLKNTPSLSCLSIIIFDELVLPASNEHLDSINNLNCLSNLEIFAPGHYFLKFIAEGSIRKSLPSTFNNLWYLQFTLQVFDDIDSLSSIVGLITSSPNLTKLVIEALRFEINLTGNQEENAIAYLEGESRSIDCLMKLEYVIMREISATGLEMEFVKLILGKSPSLKQMKIETRYVYSEKELKELLQFPRASKIAQVIYSRTYITVAPTDDD